MLVYKDIEKLRIFERAISQGNFINTGGSETSKDGICVLNATVTTNYMDFSNLIFIATPSLDLLDNYSGPWYNFHNFSPVEMNFDAKGIEKVVYSCQIHILS